MIPFIFVTILEWFTGFGVLATFRTRMPRSMSVPLALMIGMFIHSILFIGVDILHLGMKQSTMVGSAVVGLLLSHLWWKRVSPWYGELFARPRFTLRMYDFVTLWAAGAAGYFVVWAAWYWPVTPFDAMAGIDLVARQTIADGTVVNRVYSDPTLNGFLSNQPFYAPFAMLMQVIYRTMGFGNGQVWLGISAVMFSWFMWSSLRQVAHPFIAGVLWLLLIFTPELLGYTYLLQTDYINAAFLTSAIVLLYFSAQNEEFDAWAASAVLFAAACWSRTETIALVGLGLIVSIPFLFRQHPRRMVLKYVITAAAAGFFTFALWNVLYLQVLLPSRPDAASELIGFDPSRFSTVFVDTFTNVILDKGLWAATFVLFAAALILNLVIKRTGAPYIILMWIVAIFIGLEIVGTIFTAAVVEQTLRRGIFKLIPLIFLYVAASPIMVEGGKRLAAWEARR